MRGNQEVLNTFPFGPLHAVFQSEILAIAMCAHEILDIGTCKEDIYIYSESCPKGTGHNKTIIKLKIKLALCNTVNVFWVSGHTGVPRGKGRAMASYS